MKRITPALSVLAVAVALLLGGAGSASAETTHAVRIDAPTYHPHNPKRVVGVEADVYHGRRVWYVAFKDESMYRLYACAVEDQANCYWDARVFGNGRGRSFVDLHGRVHYVSKRVLSYQL